MNVFHLYTQLRKIQIKIEKYSDFAGGADHGFGWITGL